MADAGVGFRRQPPDPVSNCDNTGAVHEYLGRPAKSRYSHLFEYRLATAPVVEHVDRLRHPCLIAQPYLISPVSILRFFAAVRVPIAPSPGLHLKRALHKPRHRSNRHARLGL